MAGRFVGRAFQLDSSGDDGHMPCYAKLDSELGLSGLDSWVVQGRLQRSEMASLVKDGGGPVGGQSPSPA